MKTAIIGSRDFQNFEDLVECLGNHQAPIIQIVSGGAKGADKLAERCAKERNLPTEIYLTDYNKKYGKSAPLKRNIQIIEASERLIAFWDGKSTRTAYTIREARKRNIAVFVFYTSQ